MLNYRSRTGDGTAVSFRRVSLACAWGLTAAILSLAILNYWLDFGIYAGRFSFDTHRASPRFTYSSQSCWQIKCICWQGERGDWGGPMIRDYFVCPAIGVSQTGFGLVKYWWIAVPWWLLMIGAILLIPVFRKIGANRGMR
jgi:hypothetical protein